MGLVCIVENNLIHNIKLQLILKKKQDLFGDGTGLLESCCEDFEKWLCSSGTGTMLYWPCSGARKFEELLAS